MAYVEVTKELGETIRNLRIQNKITGKELAEHVGRSPAYISKLEKAEIKNTDEDVFNEIIEYILKNDTDGESISKSIYKSLSYNLSKKEIEQQLWYVNYDTVIRIIPIPGSLIDLMKDKINMYNISESYLLERINSNESLSEKEINDSSIAFNRWYTTDGGKSQSIKMLVTEDELKNILNNRVDAAPYTLIFSILFYILKIEKYKDNKTILPEENFKLMSETSEILNKHKFYSLTEKHSLEEQAENAEQLEMLLSTFDIFNMKILADIIDKFKILSEIDIAITNERLKSFSDNMSSDSAFMLRLISLNYKSMNNTSTKYKKEFLEKIKQLIIEYSDKTEEDIELY